MNRIERSAIWCGAALAGLAFLLFPFLPGACAEVVRAAGLSGFGLFLSFLLGVFLLVACAAAFWKERRESVARTLVLQTREGESDIALDALQALLCDELRRYSDLRDPRVDLAVGPAAETVRCRLRFKLASQPDLPGRLDIVKREVRDAFERLIPGGTKIEIVCRLDDILAPGAAPASAPENEFAGPVYPVASDDDA